MKRTEPKKIGDILNEVLSEQNLDNKLLELQILDLWPKIVGPMINRRTIERKINNGILYLRIASAPIRQELSLNRTNLIATLNKAVGKDVLNEIHFI